VIGFEKEAGADSNISRARKSLDELRTLSIETVTSLLRVPVIRYI
tara:strand:- start:55 stop:189 length:135 start_codon:yes stop_codon:yes gene_type:complete